jgi:hypothetical protein
VMLCVAVMRWCSVCRPCHQADGELSKRAAGSVCRVRADIADLRLDKVPAVRGRSVIAVSKHLCGAATDFAIRCLLTQREGAACWGATTGGADAGGTSDGAGAGAGAGGGSIGAGGTADAAGVGSGRGIDDGGSNAAGGGVCNGAASGHGTATDTPPTTTATGAAASTAGASDTATSPVKLRGVGIATCCHHRCSWRHYVAQSWFAGLGFTAADFERMCVMSSWGTCGWRGHRAADAAAAAPPAPHGDDHDDHDDDHALTGAVDDAADDVDEAYVLCRCLAASIPMLTCRWCSCAAGAGSGAAGSASVELPSTSSTRVVRRRWRRSVAASC